jgi:hypothetical protein
MRRVVANGRIYYREFETPLSAPQRVIYDAFLNLPPSQDITPLGRAYYLGYTGENFPFAGGSKPQLALAAWRAGRAASLSVE